METNNPFDWSFELKLLKWKLICHWAGNLFPHFKIMKNTLVLLLFLVTFSISAKSQVTVQLCNDSDSTIIASLWRADVKDTLAPHEKGKIHTIKVMNRVYLYSWGIRVLPSFPIAQELHTIISIDWDRNWSVTNGKFVLHFAYDTLSKEWTYQPQLASIPTFDL